MAKINLEKMTMAQLQAHQKAVAKAIAKLEKQQKTEALKAAKTAASKYGYSLNELLESAPDPSRVRKTTKAPAKYRHPENPEVTWTGRGRQPGWIKEAIQSGKSVDDFLIAD
ncbi:H-NS histone family protein [uncultured Roseobacter sp.]|uniref:H-NS histone family protein n=1 Tax=uncultured Roseobacter sp. TaxID=114847 RepID=UPI002635CB09|nr:H-NS histone family protein [uncultured Roseobacter sp.]